MSYYKVKPRPLRQIAVTGLIAALVAMMLTSCCMAMHIPHLFKKKPQSQNSDAARKAAYACPMHPDVVRNQPGHCPKCGMSLEAK